MKAEVSSQKSVVSRKPILTTDFSNGVVMSNLGKAKVFTDLIVWQKAHEFVLGVYRYTENFPKTEVYGLTSQFRGAAVSIAASIAEGFRKRGKIDKTRFYNIAQGSLEECRYYLIRSHDLPYGKNPDLSKKLEGTRKPLDAFTKSLLNPDY